MYSCLLYKKKKKGILRNISFCPVFPYFQSGHSIIVYDNTVE